MWIYDKKLQYPVNIKQTNAKLAKAIITQYGGADGFRYDFQSDISHYTVGFIVHNIVIK